MTTMLNPSFQKEDLHIPTISSRIDTAVSEKPGVEGINPVTLVVCMLVGGGMWMGLFHIGHSILQAIF